jgi:hypothetical protein
VFRLFIDGIKSIRENPKLLLWLAAAGLTAAFLAFCPDIIKKISDAVSSFFKCEEKLDNLESKFAKD